MSDTTKQVFLYPTARKKNKKGTPTYYHHTWFFVGDLGTSSCILGGSTKCNRTKKHLKSRSTALSVFRPNMSKGPNPSKSFSNHDILQIKSKKYWKIPKSELEKVVHLDHSASLFSVQKSCQKFLEMKK